MIMISNQEQIFNKRLNWIIKELNQYKHKDKELLMYNYIETRLNISLDNYYVDLQNLYNKYNNLDDYSIKKLKKEI